MTWLPKSRISGLVHAMQSNGPLKQVLEHVVEYKERRPGLIA